MNLPTRYIGKEGEGSGIILPTAVEDLYNHLGFKVTPKDSDFVDAGLPDGWRVTQQGDRKVLTSLDGAILSVGMKMPEVVECVLFHQMPDNHIVFQG